MRSLALDVEDVWALVLVAIRFQYGVDAARLICPLLQPQLHAKHRVVPGPTWAPACRCATSPGSTILALGVVPLVRLRL